MLYAGLLVFYTYTSVGFAQKLEVELKIGYFTLHLIHDSSCDFSFHFLKNVLKRQISFRLFAGHSAEGCFVDLQGFSRIFCQFIDGNGTAVYCLENYNVGSAFVGII